MGRMAGGGDAWGLQKDPCGALGNCPGLQLRLVKVLCSVHQLSGICRLCQTPPASPAFFLLAATPASALGLWQPILHWGNVAASQPCCLHRPLALTFLSHLTSPKVSFLFIKHS